MDIAAAGKGGGSYAIIHVVAADIAAAGNGGAHMR